MGSKNSGHRNWSDKQIERCKEMVAEGYSASEIAADIGKTRNSVIGLVHRLELSLSGQRKTPWKRRGPGRKPKVAGPKQVRVAASVTRSMVPMTPAAVYRHIARTRGYVTD